MNGVSITDRLLVLANRVAEKLEPRHPDLTLRLLGVRGARELRPT